MERSQMRQFNLKDKLLMSHNYEPIEESTNQLRYEAVETEGECVLKSVVPVLVNKIRYNIFCLISILLIGLPVVFVYWYPRFKLWLYYDECDYQHCTHFAIINYDDQLTFAQRQEETYPTAMAHSRQNNMATISSHEQTEDNKFIYFINRYMKYRLIISPGRVVVKADIYDYESAIKQIINQSYVNKRQIKGKNESEVVELRRRFGPGVMIIQKPGLLTLFFREIVQPLYFFIIFTLGVWIWQGYYYYCSVIFVTTVVGIVINLYETYSLNKRIFEMAYYEVDVHVLRNDKVVKISSKDIVPSDIVFLKDPINIPFDAIVLEGSTLINQSALTGESVPVVRKAEELQSLSNMAGNHIPIKNNLICQGTTLIQVDNKKKMEIFQKYRQTYGVPVYVIRTNFVTLKGQLIRIISFPIEKTNIFQKQSSMFLVFLLAVAIISYSTLILRLKGLVKPKDLIVKFLDLITITVPPGLPVSMTFGIIHAVQKLKKKNIFCVSPNKVIMGGLVDLICFDKTGTLTEDFMDFKCLVPARSGSFQKVVENSSSTETQPKMSISQILKQNPQFEHILTNMATNHTITKIIESGENVGDPMEVKLFQFGGYKFDDQIAEKEQLLQKGEQLVFGFSSERKHYGAVIRRMDFDSHLLRMSVIAKSTVKEGTGEYFLYTKGSPESLVRIFTPSSLPKNYNEILKQYASEGFRVLAIGHKRLRKDQILLQRTEIETQMQFDGFEIFQNRLKPESKPAIMELKQARIPCVMITGDNALTGCNIAFKCKIADIRKRLFIFNYKAQQQKLECDEFNYEPDQNEIYETQSIHKNEDEEQQRQLQMKEIKTGPTNEDTFKNPEVVENAMAQILSQIETGRTQICLTGSAYSLIFSNIKLDEMDNQRKKILMSTRVYARAKPNDKARIIMSYQHGLNKVVSMCGDGANDCGALKQSDAGLSLSQTEASISAPFTSKVTNIGSMIELIKQCRAGLVTNFSLFNIMALYSLIQYTSAVLCQYMFSYPTDFGFLYWDIFGNFFFFLVFGYTGTADKLSQLKPSRSLFTVTNLFQVASMYLIQLSGQIMMLFAISNFFADEIGYWEKAGFDNNYKSYRDNDNTFSTNTPESSILFLFSNFMYMFSFVAFSISKPWRKQFYTNVPFMIILIFVFAYSTLMVVVPQSRLPMLEIQGDNKMVNLFTLLAGLAFGMFMYINQKCILEPISGKLRKCFPDKQWL